MVTIASFSTPEEAHLLRIRLGAGGVQAFIRDEYTIQLYWFYSNALGGVRVDIADGDLKQANEILQIKPGKVDSVPCPQCKSNETERDETTRRFSFLSVLLFSLPLPIAKNRHNCRECRHTWKDIAPKE